MQKKLLPYFEERRNPVELLVFHCSAFCLDEFINCMHNYKTSAHYFIAEDGQTTMLVEEDKQAYHAGAGSWRGLTGINARSVGIELESQTMGQKPYSPAQIASLIKLSRKIIKKYGIKPENIIGHSDSAPTRKPDPGICFPWKELAARGIGLYPGLTHLSAETNIAKLLSAIGYDTSSTDCLNASAWAFCRRFAPQLVTPDFDLPRLLNNVLPQNFDFMQTETFINALRRTAFVYTSLQS